MIAAQLGLLWALLGVDGGFAGQRAVAGRSGRLRIGGLLARAFAIGAAIGLGVGLIPLGAGAAALGWPPVEREVPLQTALSTLCASYGGFALLIATGYALRRIPSIDVRSGASIVLFGPLTLLRPIVIAAAGLAAAVRAADPVVAALVAVAVAGGLGMEAAIDRAVTAALRRRTGG